MRLAVRAGFVAAAWLLAPGAPALAQNMPQVISPLRVEMDHNGVNLIDGKFTMPTPTLGVPAAPHLTFDRAQNAAPYISGKYMNNGTSNFSVHTGTGTSESFQCSDSANELPNGAMCGSVTGTGSVFKVSVPPYRYTQAGTGAVWWFSRKHVDAAGSNNSRSVLYYASSVAYPGGETLTYTYDTDYLPGDPNPSYRPSRIDSSNGYYIQLTYQPGAVGDVGWNSVATAKLFAVSDPNNPIQQLVYSGDNVTQVGTDGSSRTSTCTGCALALGTQVEVYEGSKTLPGESSPTLQVAPNTSGQVVASVTRDGVPWTYSYANLRFVWSTQFGSATLYDSVTVDGPNGFHNVYSISSLQNRNYVTGITDSLGRHTALQYDELYRLTQMISPEGNRVAVAYDGYGNITTRTTYPNTGSGAIVEIAHFPVDTCVHVGCYRPDWVHDALGRRTDFVFDGDGLLTEQTDPADAQGVRKKTYVTYLTTGKVVRVCGDTTTCGTPNEIRTEVDYWGATLLPAVERRIDAAQGITLTTTYTYDSAGRPTVVDGPLPGTDDAVYTRYDGYGRKSWEIGPKGSNGVRNARKFTYRDSDDKVIEVEEGTVPDQSSTILTPLTRTDSAYDAHRNPVREAVSANGTTYGLTERSFDDRGELICQAQRMNMALFGAVTDACQLVQPDGSQGPDRITRNIYDMAGQLLQVQRAYATPLQQNYATYEYTPNGKQKAVIDANGNRAEMTFDAYDRQLRWIFPSNTPGVANQGDYEEYGYDAAGNRTSLRKRDNTTILYQHDNLNRLRIKTVPQSATGAAGYSVYYGYDVRGLQTWARFGSDSGPGVATQYDGFGRVGAATTSVDGTARTLTSSYDAASNRIALTGDTAAWNYTSSYGYDAAGRLTGLNEGGHPIADLHYDTAGRRSSLGLGYDSFPSSAAYGYDPAGRLQNLTHHLAGNGNDQALTFDYNPASQIVRRTSSNAAYASNTALAVDRAYGVNGLNQYTGTTSNGTPSAAFAYDLNGNLISDGSHTYLYDAENRLVSAATTGGNIVTLSYDPMGRLWQVAAPSGTTRFLYDGDRLAIEYDGAGTLLRSYDHGTGPDEPLVWYEATSGGTSRRYLHADHQGSIIAVADQNGNPIAVNAYDEWGIPNASNLGRFGYTGQAWLPELGMWYYKARLYSPTLGRFLQTDPIGYKDQVNLYAYVSNDPIDGADPIGLAEANTCSRVGGSSCSGSYSGSSSENLRTLKLPPPSAPGPDGGDSTVGRPNPYIHWAGHGRPGGSLPAPATPSRDRILVDAADRSAESIPPFFNSLLGRTVFGWLRGILIHREFGAQVTAMGNPMYNAEVSYLRGVRVPYGRPGSVRADAVVGPIDHPLFAIELKTGGAFINRDQYSSYRANLPPGTLLQEIIVP